nr:MAG TPA: hypothetical protein [Caudoviricetes sp.]
MIGRHGRRLEFLTPPRSSGRPSPGLLLVGYNFF